MGILCCKPEEIDFTDEIELNHFNLLRSVGKGAFGKVRVVQHKGTQQIYALKYINKAKCIKMRAVENIIQERRLLEEVENPFVCNLRFAFQDDENLFMVLDLMLGGDLRFHLDRMGTMTEDMVRFYTAEISCGLAYLHSKKIVHRDLKPDNILLDEFGHAHLTDFNIAVHYREEKPLTAVAGSMAYMAPEVLAKKGYFSAVDWWSLGVVAYELAFGRRPYRAKTNEALTAAIINESLGYPQDWAEHMSVDGKDCITQSKRANFDATHELEELLLEDNPLKAKPRKKRKEGDPPQESPYEGMDPAIANEMRIMDEKFTVYDSTKPRGERSRPPASSTSNLVAANSGRKISSNAVGAVADHRSSMHRDVMEGRDEEVNMSGLTDRDSASKKDPSSRRQTMACVDENQA
ncbi:hypothetical protein HK104_007635 [Borealophlyctis nickersoniae]|nr:hypothetical protein HK104_007635 [Borealophlyctis nickersoniae]